MIKGLNSPLGDEERLDKGFDSRFFSVRGDGAWVGLSRNIRSYNVSTRIKESIRFHCDPCSVVSLVARRGRLLTLRLLFHSTIFPTERKTKQTSPKMSTTRSSSTSKKFSMYCEDITEGSLEQRLNRSKLAWSIFVAKSDKAGFSVA